MASVTINLSNTTSDASEYRVYVKEDESNYAYGTSGTISGLEVGQNYNAMGSRGGWPPRGTFFTLSYDGMSVSVDMDRL